jgi:hypothetical protein
MLTVDTAKRVPLVFFRTEAGSEPVREWLLELSKMDRRIVGVGLKELEFGWPSGCRFVVPSAAACSSFEFR